MRSERNLPIVSTEVRKIVHHQYFFVIISVPSVTGFILYLVNPVISLKMDYSFSCIKEGTPKIKK